MKIKYIVDKDGNILPAEQFLKRECSEWASTFRQAFKECGDSGKQFVGDCADGVADFAKELGGIKK